MKVRKYSVLLAVIILALSGLFQIAAAQDATATPEPVSTFDIQPVLTDYLQNLPEGFKGIKPENALKELTGDAKPFLIDVRDEKEITDSGYIAGAVLIPLRTLTQSLDKLPAQDQPIIVYCGIGHRGAIAVEVLNLLGYTNARSISGGFAGWKAAGLPVESGLPGEPIVSDAAAPAFDEVLFEAVDTFVTTLPDGFFAVPPATALKNLGEEPKPLLIDVRGDQELQDNGYIEGAVNIPLKTLLDDPTLFPVDKDAPIIVYCAVGHRGAMAMTTLHLLGYTDVTSIGGGFNNWVKGGLPIVKPA